MLLKFSSTVTTSDSQIFIKADLPTLKGEMPVFFSTNFSVGNPLSSHPKG